MANFFYTGGSAGWTGINMDLVREVIQDTGSDKITIYFDKQHTVELSGDAAKEFIEVVVRLKSESKQQLEAIKRQKEVAAKAVEPKRPKPALRSSSQHTQWS
jgi:hypothetical protein